MIFNKKQRSIYQKYSKVSGTNSSRYRRIIYYCLISVTITVFIVVLFFTGSHAKKPNRDDTIDFNVTATDYRSALATNMAKLASLHHKLPVTKAFISPDHLSSKHSGRYLMRQNAPTRMFTAASPLGITKNNSNLKNKVFSDSSAYASFANTMSVPQSVVANQIPHPDFTIPQGEFIHAVLETAIDSDLPGMLRAVTMRPVYSTTKDRLLIPKGSRLVGQYSSMTPHGVNRIMIIWNRIILPNGISVQVDSPGTDAIGRAGEAADRVDTHFFARFGHAALLSLIGAGAANVGVNGSDVYNASQQYRTAIAQSFQKSAQKSLHNAQSIKPTLHVYQGALINVFVAHDLSFYRALNEQNYDL